MSTRILFSQAVSSALTSLDLTAHSGARCAELSGGNRRKLCAAVALMGGPALVLMDEPTR